MLYNAVPRLQKEGVIRLFKSSEPDKYPDGGQCRDFIYVKDVVRITCDFLENELSGIFNIGLGKTTTWNEIAEALFKALQKPAHIEYIDMPENLVGQYQNYTCADMSKLFSKLGIQSSKSLCKYSVEEAVIEYVRNYFLKDKRW